MILYHLDSKNRLVEGQLIELTKDFFKHNPDTIKYLDLYFPDGLSQWGLDEIRLHQYDFNNDNDQVSLLNSIREQTLEYTRNIYFPKFPSRFQSLFAVQDIKSIKYWIEIIGGSPNIWQIEADDSQCFCFDASKLITPTNINPNTYRFSMSFFHVAALNYWSTYSTQTDSLLLHEYLVKPPIKILKNIDL